MSEEIKRTAELSHLNGDGLPRMVDVGGKDVTSRSAIARGQIQLPSALEIACDATDVVTKKGSIIHTAIVAGTQAAKRTSDLIPFCHPLPIEGISFTHQFLENQLLELSCEVRTTHKTGVEMEALTGVSTALLTVYDMCKSAGQDMMIQNIEIICKTGGKSDVQKCNSQKSPPHSFH